MTLDRLLFQCYSAHREARRAAFLPMRGRGGHDHFDLRFSGGCIGSHCVGNSNLSGATRKKSTSVFCRASCSRSLTYFSDGPIPMSSFPAVVAAWQTDQPMYCRSAKKKFYRLNSLNLAPFLLLDPVPPHALACVDRGVTDAMPFLAGGRGLRLSFLHHILRWRETIETFSDRPFAFEVGSGPEAGGAVSM